MTDQPDPARSFGSVADAYDRGRPGYPTEAVTWLSGGSPVAVLELGAGTGKLTEALVGLGHAVYATDPDDEMLARLRTRLPDVPTSVAPAEQLPAPDMAYDVVVVGQAFHWFDHGRALAEIARVLGPGGRLGLVWNERDELIPWVRKLGRIIGTQEQLTDPTDVIAASGWFAPVETETFRHWQTVNRESVQDLVLSRSNLAVLDEDGRRAKLAEVLDLYDDYGRGMDGMQLPYVARCFRTVVIKQPDPRPAETVTADAPEAATDAPATDGAEGADGAPGEPDDMVLIDFR